jgi:hypothetical protein
MYKEGMCLISKYFLPTDINIELKFNIPELPFPVEITGIVARNKYFKEMNYYLCGIKFSEVV